MALSSQRGMRKDGWLRAFETAMTVPSGAFSRNLYRECASRKSSNSPAIVGLPKSRATAFLPMHEFPDLMVVVATGVAR